MSKIDFSALKKADLQSVAPIGDGLRPNGASGMAPKTSVPVLAEAEPVVESVVAVPAGRKISITGLRGGNPASAAPAEAEAPKDSIVEPLVSDVMKESEAEPSVVRKSPLIRIGKSDEGAETGTEATVEEGSGVAVAEASKSEFDAFDEMDPVGHAAEVIGSEAEALAKKLLESEDDVDSASIVFKKDPQEEASAPEESSVPENVSGKEFFPNLPVGDDFLSEFIGIDPPAKTQTESKKIEASAEASAPVALQSKASAEISTEPAIEAADETAKSDSAPVETGASVPEEAVDAVSPTEATAEEGSGVSGEVPMDGFVPTEAVTEYVEAVAKDFSAVRKGGLSSLFSNKKVLIPSVAAFFGTFAVIGYLVVGGTVSKTSVPEIPPPVSESVTEPIPPTPSDGPETSVPPSAETPVPPPADAVEPPVGTVEPLASPIPPNAVLRVSAPGFESYVNPIRKPNRKPVSTPNGE